MANIEKALSLGSRQLDDAGIADARREASSLLSLATEKDWAFFFAHPEYELTTDESRRFEEFLRRRTSREPLQYIRGTQEFYRLEFDVTPDVLIPRPETEMLVEHSIEILREIDAPRFCEVGIGSGCIAVSILHNLPAAFAIGLDISEKAIAVAERNARKHSVSERLRLRRSDIFSALAGEECDLIVSNPPYISREELADLQPEVRDFEPHAALTDGDDGLSAIGRIVRESPNFLIPGGYLLVETGAWQAAKVLEMFAPEVWLKYEILPDLQCLARMARARLRFSRNF